MTPPARRAYPHDLTDEERKAIDGLVRLARRWPDTLGIFSWSGGLVITDRRPEVLDAIDDAGYGQIRTIDAVPHAIRAISNDGGDPDEFE